MSNKAPRSIWCVFDEDGEFVVGPFSSESGARNHISETKKVRQFVSADLIRQAITEISKERNELESQMSANLSRGMTKGDKLRQETINQCHVTEEVLDQLLSDSDPVFERLTLEIWDIEDKKAR